MRRALRVGVRALLGVRPLLWMTALLAVTAGLGARPERAAAHGPCTCTVPAVAAPGATVTTGPAYLAVWNPGPHWFAGGAGPSYLASAHRAAEPTRVVLQRARPRYPKVAPRGRFRVPVDAAPGVHLLLVLDGSEGGTHGTWDYVHVVDPGAGRDTDAGALHVELALVRDVLPPL